MNERIKELAEQATRILPSDWNVPYNMEEFDKEKFAELIVNVCVGIIEGGRFLHDEAPTAIFARECSTAIKRHFGVE